METIANRCDHVSIPQTIALDASANERIFVDAQIRKEQEKNACEPMQIVRTRKSKLLIVDEEWW